MINYNTKTITTNRSIIGTDKDGKKVINQYTFIRTLGSGSFAKVKLVYNTLENRYYAVKVFNKVYLKKKREVKKGSDGQIVYKDALEDVQREIEIMKDLRHPNVLQLYEIINDPEDENFYIVLDYAKNGQIMDWNEKTNEFEILENRKLDSNYIKRIMQDLFNGMQYRKIL